MEFVHTRTTTIAHFVFGVRINRFAILNDCRNQISSAFFTRTGHKNTHFENDTRPFNGALQPDLVFIFVNAAPGGPEAPGGAPQSPRAFPGLPGVSRKPPRPKTNHSNKPRNLKEFIEQWRIGIKSTDFKTENSNEIRWNKNSHLRTPSKLRDPARPTLGSYIELPGRKSPTVGIETAPSYNTAHGKRWGMVGSFAPHLVRWVLQ